MTQRKPPVISSGSSSERKSGDSYLANGKLPPDYSLQIAFGELQHHLRQSRTEIERLNRQRAKLAAEVEAKSISLDFLQQELEKKDKERRELQVQLMQSTQENEQLQMRLSLAASESSREPTLGYMTYPGPRRFGPAAFKYRVELGEGDSAESWEGVSQHLLSQMYSEMTELQELGKKLALDSTPLEETATVPAQSPNNKDDAETEEKGVEDEEDEDVALDIVSALSSQLKIVKDGLVEQRKSLLALSRSEVSQKAQATARRGALSPAKDDSTRSRLPLPNRRLPRHSADVPHPPRQLSSKLGSVDGVAKSQPPHLPQGRKKERVCPICETCFPATIAQDTFENHVLQHLG